jgi:YebC/PmpR family DNA-binding regulatory protein
MSGHNKWSTIKHKKGAADAKRGKIFTKIIKEITTAARIGGGDPGGNPRLRKAIDDGKSANMPAENVDRAIKKGTGELDGVVYDEVTYEGYGPEGVAVLLEVMTDNKNRTVAEIRHAMNKHNGNLGENGCVAWNFEKKGVILIAASQVPEDDLLDAALEAGAEDVATEGDTYEVVTAPNDVTEVKETLEAGGISIQSAELTMLPKNTVAVDDKTAESALRLMDALEDLDDIQNVYANFDLSEEIMARMEV